MRQSSNLTHEGWGVYRIFPWHMHGIYLTQSEADVEAKKVGSQYTVDFGSSHAGTGNFTLFSARMHPALHGCA